MPFYFNHFLFFTQQSNVIVAFFAIVYSSLLNAYVYTNKKEE